ncbi:hypothetical protein CPB86DRAFT_848211 [Serendipita vermifera]|nr:hypothetical protein CPB86DRAFT_848211 [Serendipita vermifera]
MNESKSNKLSTSQGQGLPSKPAVGAAHLNLTTALQAGDLNQTGIPQGLILASNVAIGVGSPRTTKALQPGKSTQSSPFQDDRTSVTLDTSIGSLKVIKEAAEAIPQFGGSIKATCGIMVLVLEIVKRCKENRDGWRNLAEVMQEKNQSVISLLDLYRQAPQDYELLLEQANRYQK